MRIIMKKLLFSGKIFFLVLLMVPFHSCTDLEEEVFSDLTPQNFPASRSDVVAAFASAYTNLYGLLNHNSYMSLNQVAADDLCIPHRTADWLDGGQWLRIHRHQTTPQEQAVNNGWNWLYRGALQCNSIIQLLGTDQTASLLSAEEIAQFTGEMRALRALFYFWLMDAYGNVPLITGDEETVDPQPANTPRAQIYDFIVSELESASAALPKAKGVETYARFNYYAAQALLAKVKLNAEVYTGTADWAGAAAAADEVINSSLYSLTDDYFENFGPDNDNGFASTSENILVIPYDEILAPGFNLVQMTLHYQSQATFNLQEQPWNGYCTIADFYNSYEDGDARKGEYGNQQVPGNFLAGPQYAADGVTRLLDGTGDDPAGSDEDSDPLLVNFKPELNELEPGAWRDAGARVFKFTYENGAAQSLNNDFPILRYSDVLLTKAEALWRQNPADGTALILVNQVRERAGVDAFAELNADNLLAERGREMFYENWRRNDMIRFGVFDDAWWEKPASDPTKAVFPIPQDQLNANKNLQQNPGY
jgi:hypothetical protein